MYFLTGERIGEFVEKYERDPQILNDLENGLENVVAKEFEKCMFDYIDTEEHEISVTYPDEQKPNAIKVYNSTTVFKTFTLKNNKTAGKSTIFPYVAFSRKGSAQGKVIYGNYGKASDLLIVQHHQINLNGSILLLRLGHISVRTKILEAVKLGVKGILLFWDESTNDPTAPLDTTYIPIVSAGPYTEGEDLPSLPVQTISANQANWLLKSMTGPVCPHQWQFGLKAVCRLSHVTSDNITVQVKTFNHKQKKIITNIIGTIYGHTEKDRYALVGAPRSAFPGHDNDVISSTGLILQLAHSLSYVQKFQKWKPRRTIKIVSWGGAEFSDTGLNLYIESHREILRSRAIAYFDIDQLVFGDVTLSATMSPLFQRLLSIVTDKVPDPTNPEETVREVWLRAPRVSVDSQKVSFQNYHTDPSKNAFVHEVGVPSLHLQYVGKNKTTVSVKAMQETERHHHYKYHAAAGRVMVLVLLELSDDQILPYSVDDFCHDLHLLLWTASDYLKDCSKNKVNFEGAITEIQDLLRTTKTLQNHLEKYVKIDNVYTIRAINDQMTILDKMFIVANNRSSSHLLYPVDKDGVMSTVRETCHTGQITQDWTPAKQLKIKIQTILKQMDLSLRLKG